MSADDKPVSQWTQEDIDNWVRKSDRYTRYQYYRSLARLEWGTMTTREKRKLRRLNPIAYSIVKGVAENG